MANVLELAYILSRPDLFIGAIGKDTQTLWVYENEEMVCRSVTYVPGLYKIFDEILVNAAVTKRRDPSMDSVKVVIDVEKNQICVCYSGDVVPLEGVYAPEIYCGEGVKVPGTFWGRWLRNNYDKNVKKTTGGRNGYGAKLTNIFSTEFIIEIADGKRRKKYKQVFENNMGKKSEPVITKCNKSENWTKVTFKPDLKKFNMTELENDVVALMSKRVYDIAGCLGKTVKVELNSKRVPIKSFSDYVDLYLSAADKSRTDPLPRITEKVNDRWEVCVSLSDGKFQQVSFVNSIATIKGGTHVDYVTSQVTNYIVGIVNKKNKNANVKTHNVKNHLWVFVNALIDSPAFDSQTKEILTLPAQSSFGSEWELSEDILKKVAKSGVVENLLSWPTFKQELKKRDGAKTGRVEVEKLKDADDAGGENSQKCTLILTEGDSATELAMVARCVMGSRLYGVFPLKGKPLNVRRATDSKIINNKEIANINKILGLKHEMVYKDAELLRYGRVMLLTDQDHDGSHIKGLIINFFHSCWPLLLQVPSFLHEFLTPIVKATHETEEDQTFYSILGYERWKESLSGNETGWTFDYYKGLAASSSEEGIDHFSDPVHIKEFVWKDEKDGEAINLAFSKEKIEARKKWVSDYDAGTPLDPKEPQITYSDFVHKELIWFCRANLKRSIPSIVDGLKRTQRKIIYCAFQKKLVKKTSVFGFMGYVKDQSVYRHGQQSLATTIIGMAQDLVGSNNVNLLQPNGQFGTRASGRKVTVGRERYISTELSPVTSVLFPKDDDVLLDYLYEYGLKVEPTWYMPIIPFVLVNGADGTGSGWSTFIPNYNPREIVANIRRLLNRESMVPMHPWYRGFKGTIRKTASEEGGCTYTTTGLCKVVNDTTLRIEELPIGKWTDDYIQFLKKMKADNGKSFIQSIKENGDGRYVDLEITLVEENMLAAQREGFLKFKLTTTIGTNNMHLFDRYGVIKKYATAEEILEEFFHIRFEYYGLRKEIMLKNLELELLKLNDKVKNVLLLDQKLKEKYLNEILEEMAKPVEAAVAGETDAAKDTLDYLSKILDRITTSLAELSAQRDKMINAVEDLKNATPKSLWLKDLEAFDKELDELDQQEKKRQVTREKIREKTAPKKASESVTTEASNSAMDTDNKVAEVVKPKGRQGTKRKAPAAKEVGTDRLYGFKYQRRKKKT